MPKTFKQIKEEFVAGVRVSGAKTNNPVVVAIVGAIGSGKSTIARELKKHLGWAVTSRDKIRVMLREKGRGFNPQKVNEVNFAMLASILKNGGNVILDSDAVIRAKRKKLEKFARMFRAKVVYLRLICDPDVMLERILHSRYNPKTDLFKNAVVALHEHIRRLPWHYRWSEADGGKFVLRGLHI
ncbi:MAG: ATP-binding protein, partial [Candidatus Sungbacteria bacterium]|nr:ATP-binding protein [Candidatus Sungbacteria bacterium]